MGWGWHLIPDGFEPLFRVRVRARKRDMKTYLKIWYNNRFNLSRLTIVAL